MERTVRCRRLRGWSAWAVGCLLVLGGCVLHTPVEQHPMPGPAEGHSESGNPEVVSDPVHSDVRRPLVVLLDDDANRYRQMLQVFSARLGRPYKVENLAFRPDAAVRDHLRAVAPLDVVAIGSIGYRLATEVRGAAVYYADVLNPDQGGRGLDALPSFTAQLDYWESRSPELQRIGVIGSANAAGTIARLEDACRGRGLSLEKARVASDVEFLLAFRAMVPRIDGFVVLPDGDVLSPDVIQEMISHARQNGVQTLVYSPFMFNLGADLLVQRDQVEMALSLIELVRGSSKTTGLSRVRLTERLGSTGQLSVVTSGGDAPAVPRPVE